MMKLDKKVQQITLEPRYIPKEFLTEEQLRDPDYRLKQLQKLYGTHYTISCSKCHHCR